MNNKPKTKLLTISLLCCGRPDTTERCLKSLMPIRKAIDSELQVVDTGCSPETRAIIEKYADEVFEFQWVKDFAKARNFQLDQANGQMFLYIDDDEWFLDTKYIIEFFKEKDCTTYNIGGYFQRNYLDFGAKEFQDIEVVRMCKVTPETKFVGKIHEYIEPSYGNAMFMDARAGHFGYVYENQEDNIKHSMRNVPLIKEMMEEDPDNFRWPYQLAQEYRAINYNQELMELCKESYDNTLTSDGDANELLRYRGSFACGYCLALSRLEKYDELIQFYNDERKDCKIMDIPLIKISVYAAKAFFIKKMYEECKQACELYLNGYERLGNDQGIMFIQGGLFSNDVFNETNMNLMYGYIMTIGLYENDFGPLTRYYRKITWDSKIVRIGRGFVVTLIQKASEYGKKKEISNVLNKFFTTGGFRDVLQKEIDEVSPRLSEEELNNIKAAFTGTAGEKEMKLFMDIRLLENQFAQISEWSSYNDLVECLAHYAREALKWQQVHDSWLSSGEAPVAHTTLLANGIQQFIQFADEDIKTSLTIIKNLFGIRSSMTTALGELSRLYVNYSKIVDAKNKNPEKFAEMYNLEEAVLAQIAQLDAAGKNDEAVATYRQLVDILQNNFGVDTLHI